MALTRAALLETGDAFDRVASSYDRSNRANPTLEAMRLRALNELWRHVPPSALLLELGCGPGTDTETLVDAGHAVTAIDSSPGMIARARAKLAGRDCEIVPLGIDDVSRLAPRMFDAAFSNFGPLNCVADLGGVATSLAQRLRPGGVLVASVIGRVCPWEMVRYATRGDWRRASVRFAPVSVPVPLMGGRVWTRYYTPREFIAPFRAAGFACVSLRSLALFAPPPYLEGVAARYPRLCTALHRIDDLAGTWPLLRNWGDHFLVTLRRA